jgi:hypothetical protein
MVNDPPAGVTETGFGMMFAFDRSVGIDAFGRSAGVEEHATVANNVAEAIMATRVFRVFNSRLFRIHTIHLFNSAGNPVG